MRLWRYSFCWRQASVPAKGGNTHFTPSDCRNPHRNDTELAAFSEEMLFKCLLTFIVILFYISEFLYQIQSSIVQQIILQNDTTSCNLYFFFASSTVWPNIEIGGKRMQQWDNQVKTMCYLFEGLKGVTKENPQINYSSPVSLNTETLSRKYRIPS